MCEFSTFEVRRCGGCVVKNERIAELEAALERLENLDTVDPQMRYLFYPPLTTSNITAYG